MMRISEQKQMDIGEITFIVNLLASSFGLEEKEILQGGIQNRKELKKACQRYISKKDYQDDVLFHFDILENNLDFLYNALYSEEENELDSQVIEASLEDICCSIYDIANEVISKSTREIDDKYIEELAYSYKKISTIMTDSLCKFADHEYITVDKIEEILATTWEKKYFSKISDLIQFNQMKSKISDTQALQEIEKWAREGELDEHTEELETFGINIIKDTKKREYLLEEEFFKYQQRKDKEFGNPTEWDNEYVIEAMKQVWNKREVVDVRKLETVHGKIKDWITLFKNRNLKKIESSQQSYNELENYFDEKYKVSSEDLKPMENEKNTSEHSKRIGKEKEM